MLQIRFFILFLIILIGFSECIEPYELSIGKNEVNKYVISGELIDIEGYQYVSVSLASAIDNPQYLPLGNCDIKVSNDKGNSFTFEEYSDGKYRVWIDKMFLNVGTAYQLTVITPSGVQILSEPEMMSACPEIDSVYYLSEDRLTTDPDAPLKGIQFYLDVSKSENDSRFYRWDLSETWEYHTDYPMEWYYDGTFHQFDPPDYSRNVCWMTNKIENIYTLSINSESQSNYKKFPLQYIDNKTNRLEYCYSLLINQYSLSEASYIYWDQMRINNNSKSGLYEQQPIAVRGNLYIPNNRDREVLGFFSVSSVKSKRIFIKDFDSFELDYFHDCQGPSPLMERGWGSYLPSEYPVYFFLTRERLGILSWRCVDCLVFGGTNIMPEYWPQD